MTLKTQADSRLDSALFKDSAQVRFKFTESKKYRENLCVLEGIMCFTVVSSSSVLTVYLYTVFLHVYDVIYGMFVLPAE